MRSRLQTITERQNELLRTDDELFNKARMDGDSTVFDNWHDENYRELEYLEYSRAELVSDALLREADELHLPSPPHTDKSKWTQFEDGDGLYIKRSILSAEGITDLRQVIRKERRERREVAEFWVKTIGGIVAIATGLVGALIGLVSVWKHH
jgi:hypothetical protein